MLQIPSYDTLLEEIVTKIKGTKAAPQIKIWAEALLKKVYYGAGFDASIPLDQVAGVSDFIGFASHTISMGAAAGNPRFIKMYDDDTQKDNYRVINSMEYYIGLLLAMKVTTRNIKMGVIHEVLHTLGVEHCEDKTCLMYKEFPFYDAVERVRQAYQTKGLVLPAPAVSLCPPHSTKLMDLTIDNLK